MSATVAAKRASIPKTPVVIGLIGFLTLVDLFAAQAILPSLAERFAATPAEIGLAVNASTIGMAIAGIAVAFIGGAVNRRAGVWLSLALLSAPTLMLGFVADLSTFTVLRIIQGVFMVTAFSLTMSYLSERCTAAQSAAALAGYVTGVVGSNLFGRLVSGAVTGEFGVPANFVVFAGLNLCGALAAYLALKGEKPMASGAASARRPIVVVRDHLANACLRTSFAIGFLILFGFIGVFTYVNFVLSAAPIGLSPMSLGLVYLVFLPAMLTTPFAGAAAARFGVRRTFILSLGLALIGLAMLLSSWLPLILAGLAIVGVGTFFAQATATGFVGRAAKSDRAAASGLYLSSYYLGGLAGAAIVGKIFEAWGWPASVITIGGALLLAALLALTLKRSTAEID